MGKVRQKREMEADEEVREDVGKKEKRVREQEVVRTVVKRKCVV